MTAPPGALTWKSSAERNRLLRIWRRAVLATFGEQPRCIRVAWVLADSFNTKTGYAYPSNTHLASETALPVNKVQEALLALERGGAIMRTITVQPGSQRWRAIYPAAAVIPTPVVGVTDTPMAGVTGHPQQPGVQNLRRIPRIQSSQIALAKAESARRDGAGGTMSAARPRYQSQPTRRWLRRKGAIRARKRPAMAQASPSTEQGAEAVGIEREGVQGGLVDDGIPEFLRRKPNGAAS
jgi:hypothetical protein